MLQPQKKDASKTSQQFPLHPNSSISIVQLHKNIKEFKQVHIHLIKTIFTKQSHASTHLYSLSRFCNPSGLEYTNLLFLQKTPLLSPATTPRLELTQREPTPNCFLYNQILQNGFFSHDSHMFPFVLTVCITVMDIYQGKQAQAHAIKPLMESKRPFYYP
ncbi:hypothetical protein AMTRI_Chr03g54470 [Amborella trichopoda]